MASLVLDPNTDAPDEMYALLVDAHRDLDAVQSERVNVRLVLLLANHIGDSGVIAEAIAAARQGVAPVAQARSGAGDASLH